jgi:ketosteroid isomerase-like protein
MTGMAMKPSTLCLMGLLALGNVALSQAQTAGGSVEKAIEVLENEWLQAAKSQNPSSVTSNYDDRLVSTDSSGTVTTKAQGAAYLKTTKFTSAEYENVQVTVFGDTAIATGGFKAKGTDSRGKPFDTHERWTDTWVKMPGGKWVCVASHSSTIG